jgi:GT2 family glycosyltransferase
MSKKELSIIITAYGKPDLLELCINSIQEKIGKEIDYEIIVSSSATEEATYDLMREKFSRLIFLPHKKNVGFGFVANDGLKKARGKYLFIINHDIIIKDQAIQKLLAYIKAHKSVGLVGPRLINFDGSIQNSAFKFYNWQTIVYRRTFFGKFGFAKKHLEKFLLKSELEKNEPIEVDWIMGSAMMTTAEAVKRVGGFDTRFFMYFEDVDWCWRFWQSGYKVVYNPTVKVAHYHGKASLNKNVLQALFLNRYTRIHIASAWKFFQKHRLEKRPH